MRPYGEECDPWLKHRDSGKCIKNAGLHKTGLLSAVISELEQYRVGKSGCKDQNVPLHIPDLYYFSSGSSHVLCCGGLKWACCTSSWW